MEQEVFLSGYCRQLDGSRTVTVEDGEPDCLYERCDHQNTCSIAQKITQLLKEENT